MKLRKVTINGKTYYEEIIEDNVIDPEIIEPKEDKTKRQERFEEEYKKQEKSYSSFKDKERWKRDWKELVQSIKGIGRNIKHGVGKATKNWFEDTESSTDRTNRLVKILPYMTEEDIHEIAQRILKNDPEFKGVDYAAIMPFMTDRDCDALFMKTLRDSDTVNIKMVHFVSQDCLSCLVDAYIAGKFPELDVDSLYPFLDSESVKKLFYYELKKNKK
jgi:hypothetical protein